MDAIQATKPYLNKAIELVMEYGPKLILAILVLIIGMWIIKGIKKKTCYKSNAKRTG